MASSNGELQGASASQHPSSPAGPIASSQRRARTTHHADLVIAESNEEEDDDERDERLRKEIVAVAATDPGFPVWKRRIVRGVWITLAIFLAWLTDIIVHIADFNAKINLVFFVLGCISSAAFFGIFLYLNFYTYYIEKRVVDFKRWRLSAPTAIPVATVLGFLSAVFFIVAFWSLYGWFCLPLFFVWTMGILTILSFF